ncbi:hypothetical protein [Chishuiella changwenlii]|uniref:hypothetical protein n=1 Tax=Chishuiella changwenlii TaxID=1434701 RepID=UPI002FDB10E4
MPYNFLLIPIIFSYIILRYSSFFKYNLQRRSKDVLVFETIVISIPIIIISILLNYIFRTNLPAEYKEGAQFLGNNVFDSKTRYFYSFLFGSLFCFCFVFITGFIVRQLEYYDYINHNYLSNRAVRKYGDELEKFISKQIKEGKPAQFTLKNGKVYIGFCSGGIPIPGMSTYIKIMPIYSGYRNKEDHTLKITTDYFDVLKNIFYEDNFDKFGIIGISFKKDEIVSFTIYDEDLFKSFSGNKKEN